MSSPDSARYAAKMVTQQTAMGIVIAGVCLLGLVKARWFFENTRKGRRLAAWFGEDRGLQVLCGLLAAGVLLGLLLACDVIRPLQWGKK